MKALIACIIVAATLAATPSFGQGNALPKRATVSIQVDDTAALDAFSDTTSTPDTAAVATPMGPSATNTISLDLDNLDLLTKGLAGGAVAMIVVMVVILLLPIILLALIFYFIYKNSQQRRRIAQMEAGKSPAPQAPPTPEEQWEKAIRTTFLGIGIAVLFFFIDSDFGIGIGLLLAIYGAGQAYIARRKRKREEQEARTEE